MTSQSSYPKHAAPKPSSPPSRVAWVRPTLSCDLPWGLQGLTVCWQNSNRSEAITGALPAPLLTDPGVPTVPGPQM